jgi:hypothetical protein
MNNLSTVEYERLQREGISLQEEEDPKPVLYWVGVYLCDRAFGGREEGGWYYDCGILVTDPQFYQEHHEFTPRSFVEEKEAYDFARQVDIWLHETVNVGRRPISSVLSDGMYNAMVFEGGTLPHHFPEVKPHYE